MKFFKFPCASVLSAICLFLVGYSHAGEQLSSFISQWSELPQETMEDKGTTFIRKQIMRGETLDLAELHIFAETIPAGASAPARRSEAQYEELMIVKRGAIVATHVDNSSQLIGPGSVAVTHAGEKRSFKNAGKDEATYYLFHYRTREPANSERGLTAGGSFVVDWDAVDYLPSEIGGRRNMFERPTEMFNTFEMHVSTLNPGLTNHPAHTHRAEEFVLVIEGEVKMLLGEKTVRANAGDLVYIESMIPHSLNNIGKTATTYFAFQFWQ